MRILTAPVTRAWLLCVLLSNITDAQPAGVRRLTSRELRTTGNPKAELFSVTGAAFGPDGKIYLAENSHTDMRVFESDGSFHGNIGGRGAGPGEFRHVGRFGWLGDTLWVDDPVLRRITLFNPQGKPLTTVATSVSAFAGTVVQSVLTPRGRFIQVDGWGRKDIEDAPIVRVSRDGTVRDTLVNITYGRVSVQTKNAKGGFTLLQPLSDLPIWNADRAGQWIVVCNRSAPPDQRAARIELQRFTLATGAMQQFSPAFSPVPISQAANDSILQLFPMLSAQELRSVLYLPKYFPPVSHMVVARDGGIWLERQGERPGTYVRIDATGRVSDTIQIAPGYRLADVRGDELLAIIRSADDVKPTVLLYTMLK